MENDVLDRAFMGYDQKIFPLQISAFYQALHITVIKFLPRFAARIVAVMQFLLGRRLLIQSFGSRFSQACRLSIIFFAQKFIRFQLTDSQPGGDDPG